MENVTFKLPLSKKSVTIKGYASYKITSEIQRIINNGTKVTGTGTSEKSMKANLSIDSNARLDANDRTIELMVIEFDGSSDDVLNRLSDEREGDFDFVIEQINNITNASKVDSKEKKS